MSELKWNWAYYPYLDAPNKQVESALKAGYVKVVDKDEADRAIAELKQKLDKTIAERDGNQVCIDALKQKLEDVNELIKTARKMLEDAKATAYTESVDAGMRERRLKRALWLAREWRAWCEGEFWLAVESDEPGDIYHLKCTNRIHRTPNEWTTYWQKVEQLCKKMAEKYK